MRHHYVGKFTDLFGVDVAETASDVCRTVYDNISKLLDNGAIPPILVPDYPQLKDWRKQGHRLYYVNLKDGTLWYFNNNQAMCHAYVRDFRVAWRNDYYAVGRPAVSIDEVIPVLVQTNVLHPYHESSKMASSDVDFYYTNALLHSAVSPCFLNPRTPNMLDIIKTHGTLVRTDIDSNLMYTALIWTRYIAEYPQYTWTGLQLMKRGVPVDIAMVLAQYGGVYSETGGTIFSESRNETAHTCWNFRGTSAKVLANLSSQYIKGFSVKESATYAALKRIVGSTVDRYTPVVNGSELCLQVQMYKYLGDYATLAKNNTHYSTYYTEDSAINAIMMMFQDVILPELRGKVDV